MSTYDNFAIDHYLLYSVRKINAICGIKELTHSIPTWAGAIVLLWIIGH